MNICNSIFTVLTDAFHNSGFEYQTNQTRIVSRRHNEGDQGVIISEYWTITL